MVKKAVTSAQSLAAVETMVNMIEENEWAEHVGVCPLTRRLETGITKLHNEIAQKNKECEKYELDNYQAVEFLGGQSDGLANLCNLYRDEIWRLRDGINSLLNGITVGSTETTLVALRDLATSNIESCPPLPGQTIIGMNLSAKLQGVEASSDFSTVGTYVAKMSDAFAQAIVTAGRAQNNRKVAERYFIPVLCDAWKITKDEWYTMTKMNSVFSQDTVPLERLIQIAKDADVTLPVVELDEPDVVEILKSITQENHPSVWDALIDNEAERESLKERSRLMRLIMAEARSEKYADATRISVSPRAMRDAVGQTLATWDALCKGHIEKLDEATLMRICVSMGINYNRVEPE